MKLMTAFAAVGLMLAAFLSASPAMALNTRSFVSPTGNDANACTLPAPCRTFQIAFNQTIAGGEIDVLGSAGYGPLIIDKAISIVNPGGYVASMFAAAGGDGIVINAPADAAVTLRGLTINGGGIGYNGIVFNSGASLTVDNCVVQNFFSTGTDSTGNGILIQPTSGTISFAITNTTVANNGKAGVSFYPPSGAPNAVGVIDHVFASGNAYFGIIFYTEIASGGTVSAAISNTIASNNPGNGIVVQTLLNVALTVSIDNATVSGNGVGIAGLDNARVLLGRSTVVSSGSYGIHNGTSPNSFYTFQNNQLFLNGTDLVGSALTPVSFH